jgi:uncharacterized protein YjcR
VAWFLNHNELCGTCEAEQTLAQDAQKASIETATSMAELVTLLRDMKKHNEKQDARMLKLEQFVVATHDQLQLLVEVSKGTLLQEPEAVTGNRLLPDRRHER